MPASPVVSTWTVALPVEGGTVALPVEGWTVALPVESWTVALPVKGGTAAKSRLGASPELALALATDCLTAVTDCPVVSQVLVVTSDRAAAAEARERGARVVPERHPGAGLLSACADAMAEAAHRPGPFALLRRVAGHQHHPNRRVFCLQGTYHGQAIHIGHDHITQNQGNFI